MMKIAKSLAMIAFVAAVGVYATSSFFSDVETSRDNTFTAGTIDISVDGQNPWTTSWENYLDKPCQVNYMTFEIENVGQNPANVWKHLNNVVTGPGPATWPESTAGVDDGICSSEPEFDAGGGTYKNGEPVASSYTERDNIAAFIVYDMAVCTPDGTRECKLKGGDSANLNNQGYPVLNTGWRVLIDEKQQVRVDNVESSWVYLGELGVGEKMIVSQSYHLMTWDDSGQPEVTNWAQGDTMTFDIELEARQLTAPTPGTVDGKRTVMLRAKDGESWATNGNGNGTLIYNVAGSTFDYDFSAVNVDPGVNYSLIYYADPWPGSNPGALIGTYMSDASGVITATAQSVNLNIDLPCATDANHPVGAKIWLVPSTHYNTTVVGDPGKMINYVASEYLFEMNLAQYDDTDVVTN